MGESDRGSDVASFPGFPLAFISPAVEKSSSTAGEKKASGKPGNEASSDAS